MANRILLVSLLLAIAGCTADETSDSQRAVTVWLDAADPETPFPSDAWTVADAASATGRRVDLSRLDADSLPARAIHAWDGDGLTKVRDALESLDGFSGFAPIFVPFSGSLHPDSVTADAFRLVDLTAGVTVPVAAVYQPEPGRAGWVLLHPREVLRPAHRHAVLVGAGLRDLEGNPLAAPAAQPLPLPERALALKAAGWSSRDLLGVFAFTVQDTTGEMLAAARWIQTALPAAVTDVVQTSAREIEGTFLAPDFRSGDIIPPGANPEPRGWTRIPFYLKLPRNHLTAPRPFPLAIWAHGLTGDRFSIPNVDDAAVIAIDAVEHGFRMQSPSRDLVAFEFNNFQQIRKTRDNYRQTTLDNLSLAHLLPTLDGQLRAALGGGALLRTDGFVFLGGSLGGIVGGSIIPLAPEIDHAIVVVGGAGLSAAFQDGLFKLAAPNVTFAHTPVERAMFFALVQMLFDRADGVNYLRHAIREPLPGHTPRNVLFLEVIGDPLVPNRANETWAWAAGLEWLTPIYQNPFGMPVVDREAISGNFVIDGMARTGVAYQYNPDPGDVRGLKRHGYLADHDPGLRQIEHFFRTGLDTGTAEARRP